MRVATCCALLVGNYVWQLTSAFSALQPLCRRPVWHQAPTGIGWTTSELNLSRADGGSSSKRKRRVRRKDEQPKSETSTTPSPATESAPPKSQKQKIETKAAVSDVATPIVGSDVAPKVEPEQVATAPVIQEEPTTKTIESDVTLKVPEEEVPSPKVEIEETEAPKEVISQKVEKLETETPKVETKEPLVELKPRQESAVSIEVKDVRDLVRRSKADKPPSSAEAASEPVNSGPTIARSVVDASGGTADNSFQQLLTDAREMQSLEKNDDKSEDTNVIRNAISTLVTVDFFVVCLFLVWFLAGVFGSYVLKNDDIQIAFNGIFQPLVQPALGILMIAAVADAVFKSKDEQE